MLFPIDITDKWQVLTIYGGIVIAGYMMKLDMLTDSGKKGIIKGYKDLPLSRKIAYLLPFPLDLVIIGIVGLFRV